MRVQRIASLLGGDQPLPSLFLVGVLKTGKDIAQIEPFGSFARTNSVDPARVPGPLLIAQSRNDTIVAPAVTRKFAKSVCRRGTPLRWIDMTGDHGASARESSQETIGWITSRFDGNPPPNDCRRI